MGRNSELIRQWKILQTLGNERGNTIPKLARMTGKNVRTIRRDLEALQLAGFPIHDEHVNGTKFWRLNANALGVLTRNALTFNELCALYFSRTLFECFAAAPLLADLQGALDKFAAALTPAAKKFLDRLPRVLSAKGPHAKRAGVQLYDIITRLLEASTLEREVTMRYHSQGSGREKDYVVHPYRLVHAQGGLYLIAYVPAYSELRTFAVERIRRLSVGQKGFEAIGELESDPFRNSLGVHRGPAQKVVLRFHKDVADSITERTWHPSQQLKPRTDGSIVLTMQVSDDYALRSWILGFGRYVRVESPAGLADWVREELDQTREQYGEGDGVRVDSELQPGLPFLFSKLASA